MYGHCFFSSDEGSILADMSVRLMLEAAQREERLHSTIHHTEILVRGMESLNALGEALALE
jgi:hypothetical protein